MPALDLRQGLARHKSHGARTFQAEDESAAIVAAVGASFGGHLVVTSCRWTAWTLVLWWSTTLTTRIRRSHSCSRVCRTGRGESSRSAASATWPGPRPTIWSNEQIAQACTGTASDLAAVISGGDSWVVGSGVRR
ncbi:hypothetical protein HFP48_30010 (plasmid) [Rhodococcus sp. DMU1]|nr:hypothetical protein HFP48_30010 [Rhodococcus sp. DMU1]QPG47534.1 hypothetical protein ISO16_11415 [Rhodococcus sp. M8]